MFQQQAQLLNEAQCQQQVQYRNDLIKDRQVSQ
jgi:hypothetical protein